MSHPLKARKHYLKLTRSADRVRLRVARHKTLYAAASIASLLALSLGSRALAHVIGFSRLRKILLVATLSKKLFTKPRKTQYPSNT